MSELVAIALRQCINESLHIGSSALLPRVYIPTLVVLFQDLHMCANGNEDCDLAGEESWPPCSPSCGSLKLSLAKQHERFCKESDI
eukprot:5492-Amphidinium_carterae.1